MNPYRDFVSDFARLLKQAKTLPLGGFPPLPRPPLPADAPNALIFSPHPDDEVIIGALPLRLLREGKMNVINVAVTLGSNKARQVERWKELTACCDHIGFGLMPARENGLEGVNLKTRQQKQQQWAQSVECIATILSRQQPRVIFFPHDGDWNSSHIGTHHLLVDALTKLGDDFSCFTIETEFWGAMETPNLMVESSEQDVADLITALSFHAGEVRRNSYHVRMMAWLIDNVRRGSELVGGQGGAAPDFLFGTLYRLRRWRLGKFAPVLERGRFLSTSGDPAALFRD
ncbi:MAG TPA: PIG-L family deacetylase [Verrucomicrobiae bacterium]|jgi:LmbE family N-acetylglucosaminyl deacetylase